MAPVRAFPGIRLRKRKSAGGAGHLRDAGGHTYIYVFAPRLAAVYAGVVAALFAFGVWLCQVTERDLGVHDHPGIVWDEIVGYLITMFMAPAGWEWVVLGFFLFRLFDIWKPFPIRQLERRIRGGFGNMFDDAIAAVYAWLVLQAVVRLVPLI